MIRNDLRNSRRSWCSFAVLALLAGLGCEHAAAQTVKPKPTAGKVDPNTKPASGKPAGGKSAPAAPATGKAAAPGAPGTGKPSLIGTYGDWAAYQSQSGKTKICYVLAQPKDRQPGTLKRDPAYLFISSRPGEGVHNEVSVIMGFPLKEGGPEAKAEIGTTAFDLVAKGENAWIKNAAEEGQFVEAIKKGAKLLVKIASKKGNMTTDSYSLSGISQALERVQKDCP
jgi:hypothetical protein